MVKTMKLSGSSTGLSRGDFQSFAKSLFDDSEELDSEYAKHSECHVTLLAEVDLEWAEVLQKRYKLPCTPEQMVGHWKVEGTSDYSWGFNWDCVDEVVKVYKTERTVTKTIVEWKPVCDENVPICSSKQPQSKVCLPE